MLSGAGGSRRSRAAALYRTAGATRTADGADARGGAGRGGWTLIGAGACKLGALDADDGGADNAKRANEPHEREELVSPFMPLSAQT